MPSRKSVHLSLRSFGVTAALLSCMLPAPLAQAAVPSASVQVTGLSGTRLAGPKTVSLKQSSFVLKTAATSKTCTVAQGTPLAALMQSGITHAIKDFGNCSRNPLDSAMLFVDSVRGLAGTGMQGWSYKVNNRAGTAGAADPNGPFGSGTVRHGSRILWFWCTYDPTTYACQRNLEVVGPTMISAGSRFTVSVLAFDDAGTSIPAADVNVTVGSSLSAVTNATGKVRFTAPRAKGTYSVNAVDARVGVEGAFRPAAFTELVRVF